MYLFSRTFSAAVGIVLLLTLSESNCAIRKTSSSSSSSSSTANDETDSGSTHFSNGTDDTTETSSRRRTDSEENSEVAWWWSKPSNMMTRHYGNAFTLKLRCGNEYGYAVRFSYELKGPDVANFPRAGGFFDDDELPQTCQQKSLRSYTHPNCKSSTDRSRNPFCFDRGHLVSANHLDNSLRAIEFSNVMTNIVPQAAGLNRAGGAWHLTEEIVECARDLPGIKKQVIFGGAIYNDDSNDFFLQSHGIPTPDLFWKVVIRYYNQRNELPEVAGWIMPNLYSATAEKLYDEYMSPILWIQRASGDRMKELPSKYKELNRADPFTWWNVPSHCDLS